jgi:transcriptional regulator with PAS, ATPase and Fis domain
VPPLRERTEDIRPIATALVEAHSRRLGRDVRLSESLLQRLERHPWPGNVRELNNILERAVLLADSEVLKEVDLPSPGAAPRGPGDRRPETLKVAVDRAEREAILAALKWTGDNKTRAAELLGVSVRTLWYKIRGLGLANQTAPESRRGSHPE